MAGKDDIQAKGGATSSNPGTTGKHFAAPGAQSTASIMAANAQTAATKDRHSASNRSRGAEIDRALEARALHALDLLEKAESSSGEVIYRKRHGWKLRLAGIVSTLSFLATIAFVVLLAIGASVAVGEIAADLGIDENAARFQLFVGFALATFRAALSLMLAIFAFRSIKNPKAVQAFTLLAEIQTAVSGVDLIWNVSQGKVAGISDVMSQLITIAINFVFVYIGIQANRTANMDSEEQSHVEALRMLRRESRKLGFMRFFQFVYGLRVLGVISMLAFVTRDQMVLGIPEILGFVGLSLDVVCFYLLWKRLRVGRSTIVVLSLIQIAIAAVSSFLTKPGQTPVELAETVVASSLFEILAILYFTFARRPREVLVEELSQRTNEDSIKDEIVATKGWPKWRNLILYYCVFSVLGHWMELAFCMLIRWGLVAGEYDPTNTMLWRDFLYPFPMEGAAVVICALFLYPLKNWLVKNIKVPVLPWVISFIANALMCTGIELAGGLAFNPNHELWDYSNMFMNFMGQVCLQNAIGFGIACSLITWVIYPALETFIAGLPDDLMQIIFIGAMTFNIMLQVLYLLEPEQLAEGVSQIWGAFQGHEQDIQLPLGTAGRSLLPPRWW